MRQLRNNPHLYEINLMTWLNHLSEREQKKITLENIPATLWSGLKKKGFDLIWLMGVWQRSPDSRQRARNHSGLIKDCRAILENFELEDIAGSPYAIHSYLPDPAFGSAQDLLALKKTLEGEGLSLILDFVPNHTACDHLWIKQNPEYYIQAGLAGSGACDKGFFPAKDTPGRPCIAHGKDPYFAPWTDTAQVNYSNPEAVTAMQDTLSDISRYCHGFRCDMAMLVLKDIFRTTWSRYVKDDVDAEEFWKLAIDGLRSGGNPCLFLAEVYWEREQELMDLGFNHTYDKTFYDLLVREDIQGLQTHLSAPIGYQEKMVRFLENHDEPKAMKVFGPEKIFSAMVIHATLPGMRFWHHGQLEGSRFRVPVQLGRAPVEPVNHDLEVFSEKLLQEVDHPVFHDGTWQLCMTNGWPDNQSHKNLLVWCWSGGEERRLIVVNFTGSPAQGLVEIPAHWLPGSEQFICLDPLKGESYVRSTNQVEEIGLHVELRERDFHFFKIKNR